MGAAIERKSDFDWTTLRRLARMTKNANQSQRLQALAEIYNGGNRSDGACLQIMRDWVMRFNARGLNGLLDAKFKDSTRIAMRVEPCAHVLLSAIQIAAVVIF
jgi:hypothetical protein